MKLNQTKDNQQQNIRTSQISAENFNNQLDIQSNKNTETIHKPVDNVKLSARDRARKLTEQKQQKRLEQIMRMNKARNAKNNGNSIISEPKTNIQRMQEARKQLYENRIKNQTIKVPKISTQSQVELTKKARMTATQKQQKKLLQIKRMNEARMAKRTQTNEPEITPVKVSPQTEQKLLTVKRIGLKFISFVVTPSKPLQLEKEQQIELETNQPKLKDQDQKEIKAPKFINSSHYNKVQDRITPRLIYSTELLGSDSDPIPSYDTYPQIPKTSQPQKQSIAKSNTNNVQQKEEEEKRNIIKQLLKLKIENENLSNLKSAKENAKFELLKIHSIFANELNEAQIKFNRKTNTVIKQIGEEEQSGAEILASLNDQEYQKVIEYAKTLKK
ncbi:Hypothetical_protein [Hexamita inflata]|uniref:Hypothetical_protein n=1 Tax=Hexamita inflata TaxID=28002 RepID=A0AA86NPU8_9EUKA|nr:Hypothetical protein HINF_LOCUS10643 [Hexamita inflata]